jgi:GNAT superfamily N-acetyltransferase
LLLKSDQVALAWDGPTLVGFATALTDGVLCAFIPLLEVLPDRQGLGIGSALVQALQKRLGPIYALDAVCDAEVAPFYERLGFVQISGMALRDRTAIG